MFNVPVNNRFAVLLAEKQKKEDRFIPIGEVAGDTGVSRKTLYKWEKNTLDRFDKDVIEKLCKYFGVDVSDLIEYTPDKKPKALK